jgi:hypothetical protein
MGVPDVDVHVPEQVVLHVVTIRILVGGKQSDVLIEVKRAAQRKVEVLILVHANEVPVKPSP